MNYELTTTLLVQSGTTKNRKMSKADFWNCEKLVLSVLQSLKRNGFSEAVCKGRVILDMWEVSASFIHQKVD